MEENDVVVKDETEHTVSCPECGSELVVAGRCATCYECGFSLCSL